MKGVELPINILVVVAIAVIVLLALVALYFIGFGPFSTSISIEGVKNAACSELVRRGCVDLTNTIGVNFDADGDGRVGGVGTWTFLTSVCNVSPPAVGAGDNLASLCECQYSRTSEAVCKRLCGCP
jgi:hypothetical protein